MKLLSYPSSVYAKGVWLDTLVEMICGSTLRVFTLARVKIFIYFSIRTYFLYFI